MMIGKSWRAVILDAGSLGDDVCLDRLSESVGDLKRYDKTSPEEVDSRLAGADIVIVNKVVLGEADFARHPSLKLIAVTATGTNNIDMAAAAARGIAVANVSRYGRPSLVQHTFMLILALANRLLDYVQDVKAGQWQKSAQFCLMGHPMMELEGKTLGVVGYGDLGQGVAEMGRAFGMNVLIAARPGQDNAGDVARIPLKELLPQVDVLSLHCLLSPETQGLIGLNELAVMKPGALIVNTARGGLIDEPALVDALKTGKIAGAATDVLSAEPPVNGNPLLEDDIPNLIVTPHCAWATREARQRLVDMTADNIQCFLSTH